MRAARELNFDRVESFDALIDSATPALTTVIAAEPGWSSLAPPAMLFPASSEIETSYSSQYQASVLVIGLLPDAAVSRGSVVWLGDQVALLREPLQPVYVAQYTERAWFPAATEDIAEKTRVDIDDLCALVTHFNTGVYGHWLLEGLPKLFLLKHIQKLGVEFSIVLPHSVAAFIRKWVELVLPGIRIATFNDKREYAHCRKLLIPGNCYAGGYHFHPVVNT